MKITEHNYRGTTTKTVEFEKVSIFIGRSYINVTVKNASHRAWKGAGKSFNSFEEALNNYKSVEVRLALELASTVA